ncbi:MAG: GumC family protein, partial [Acidobacteriota bacterium]
LKSRSLAKTVIDTLALHEADEFSPNHRGVINVRAALGALITKASATKRLEEWSQVNGVTGVEVDHDGWLIDELLKRVDVTPVRRSRLVDVSYEGYNPFLVAKITDTIAQTYIDQNLEARFQASQYAVGWLSERLKATKKKLAESEATLQRYKEENKIVSVSLEERQNFVVVKLNELSRDLTQAKTERIGLETLYHRLKELSKKPGMIEAVPAVIENRLIQNLKIDYARAQAEHSELSKRYGQKHPKIIRVRSKLKAIEDKIAFEVEKIIKSIETEYKVARAKEQSLVRALDAQKTEALDLNKKAIKFRALEREVETNKQIYDALLKRAEETGLTSQLENVNIRIVDPAEVPQVPAKPRILLNVVLAMIAGLTMGTGLVLFLEYLDVTVRNPENIEELLSIPCLGALGKFSSSDVASELFVLTDSKSSFSESVKTIRTNVVSSLETRQAKSLLVTSTGPKEGKTVLTTNLAASLAQMGKKVLLVDGDQRRARFHHLFEHRREPGLSCALMGETAEVMLKPTAVDTLKILTAGQKVSDPADLLSSPKMLELMNGLREDFDYLVIDSPPITAVTDALVLAKLVDAVMLIIKAQDIPREVIKRALAQLAFSIEPHPEAEAPWDEGPDPGVGRPRKIIGAVLNFVDIREDYYHYHYNRYYRKYYADERVA